MLTDFEKKVLKAIACSEYNQLNGDIPTTVEESATWLYVDDIADEVELTCNQVKGVVGSLIQKEMIAIDYDENDSLVCLTEKGLACI